MNLNNGETMVTKILLRCKKLDQTNGARTSHYNFSLTSLICIIVFLKHHFSTIFVYFHWVSRFFLAVPIFPLFGFDHFAYVNPLLIEAVGSFCVVWSFSQTTFGAAMKEKKARVRGSIRGARHFHTGIVHHCELYAHLGLHHKHNTCGKMSPYLLLSPAHLTPVQRNVVFHNVKIVSHTLSHSDMGNFVTVHYAVGCTWLAC